MRYVASVLLLACIVAPLLAQETTDEGPRNEKAKKTYQEALNYQHRHMTDAALDAFKKADKQDGGHCVACQKKMIKYGIELRDWKTAENAAQEGVEQAQGDRNIALAHYQFGVVLISEGLERHKDEFFSRAHDELTKALAAVQKFPGAIFADGQALGHLKQDDAAKSRFEEFVKMRPEDSPDRQRALRYISQPELARARNGSGFCNHYHGQTARFDGRPGRKGRVDRFLGNLVRTLPRGAPPHAGDREKVPGTAARSV